jgi:hypothetical protein
VTLATVPLWAAVGVVPAEVLKSEAMETPLAAAQVLGSEPYRREHISTGEALHLEIRDRRPGSWGVGQSMCFKRQPIEQCSVETQLDADSTPVSKWRRFCFFVGETQTYVGAAVWLDEAEGS